MSAPNYSAIVDPAVQVDYPAIQDIATFSTVAANIISAYDDMLGAPQTLRLEATQDIKIEAVDNLQLYTRDGNFQMYTSTWDGANRTDTQIMKITNSNGFTSLQTDLPSGFVFQDAVKFNDLLWTTSDVVAGNNMYVNGDIFGQNVNVFKEVNSNDVFRVGYAFHINDKNNLELVKYSQFSNNSVHQRVAIFGIKQLVTEDPSDVAGYDAFSQFDSVRFSDGYSAGGIGSGSGGMGGGLTTIAGEVTGSLIPNVDAAYDLGADGFRFRDLYLTGQTLYMGNSRITTDTVTGDIQIKDNTTNELKTLVVKEIILNSTTNDTMVLKATPTGLHFGDSNGELVASTVKQLTVADPGTAAVPTLAFVSGAGLWAPSSNQLAMSTLGLERLRLTEAGNLGIGKIAPTCPLDVEGELKATSISTAILTVSDNATLNTATVSLDLAVTGSATIGNSMTVQNILDSHILTVDTDMTVGQSALITKNLTVNSNLDVLQTATLSTASVTNNLSVGQTATLSTAAVTNNLSVGQTATLNAAAVTTTLSVGQTATLNAATVTNDLTVGQSALVTKDLTVNSNLTVLQAATVKSLTVDQSAQLNKHLTVNSNLDVLQTATVNTLAVGQSATIANTLTVNGNVNMLQALTINSNLNVNSDFAVKWSIDNTRTHVGIGTVTPSYPLHVTTASNNISVYASYDIVGFSDSRVKTNFLKVPHALDKIAQINGYTFTRTDTADNGGDPDRRMAGVIAQEVQQVLPEVVYETENGMLTVAYGNMAALFIEAIKELREMVADLQDQVFAPKV